MNSILSEMNTQLFNYVTGKMIEMLIVGSISYLVFTYLDLPYTILLSMGYPMGYPMGLINLF